ncbi:hypothetical protein Q9R08_01030 [Microbacterium sp. QXD-8]|uniref:Uncharacterized protein n=1 Tax=Microbacterium psychrotolerans TaxID=3068321 RepID=A0ABU0YW41_9MICO|nr:hypothetical protein [Microbacterium sp. QXD-8]MDQ7876550.1 hypothetical protein [Microbacterium sp. QXD-8]
MYSLNILPLGPVAAGTVTSDEPLAPAGGGISTDGAFSCATGGKASPTWERRPVAPVRIYLDGWSFSFWADDVTSDWPLVVRRPGGGGCIVTTATDTRDAESILAAAAHLGHGVLAQVDADPEDSFEAALARNRRLFSPTWLGLSRDIRTFGMSFRDIGASGTPERMWDWIAPQWNGQPVKLAEAPGVGVRYQFMLGRGIGPHVDITRRLLDGVLPILTAELRDGGVLYEVEAFVTWERRELTQDSVEGTPYLMADGRTDGHMFTTEQQVAHDDQWSQWEPDEETALFLRVRATNTEEAPRFAFLTTPAPYGEDQHHPLPSTFEPQSGHYALGVDRVCVTATQDGGPLRGEEVSQLLLPHRSTTFEFRIPHQPISGARAESLRDRSHDTARDGVEQFWRRRLGAAAQISVPEKRIDEMVRAGLLHLDLITFGSEPDGPLAPTIGIYAPIGSESAPIIQFYDSIGRPDLAARSLDYFLAKQHPDGFMQNFGGYMLETEATLWALGEHFRYTLDRAWLSRVFEAVARAVDYIARNRSARREAGDARGLIVGKTADPDDVYASFMLNGYAYLGLSRAAEMATALDDHRAAVWHAKADDLRRNLRESFFAGVEASPVVPLSDGRWVRTAPPWPGSPGPLTLDRSNSRWFTHGSGSVRDTLLGPLWLAAQEVLDADDPAVSDILDYQAEILFHDNVAFSQPYYSPHPLLHVRRNEPHRFLKAYYAAAASLADPETYSFWEHYFHASPHKTHEEAWFLMQTRWMLYLEAGDTLRLLPAVPRTWLGAGETISIEGARSYFGAFDLRVEVDADGERMRARLHCDRDRAPHTVTLRLPHPTGRRAQFVSGGSYDPSTEVVTVTLRRDATAEVTLHF